MESCNIEFMELCDMGCDMSIQCDMGCARGAMHAISNRIIRNWQKNRATFSTVLFALTFEMVLRRDFVDEVKLWHVIDCLRAPGIAALHNYSDCLRTPGAVI